jgi:hypothetical protein
MAIMLEARAKIPGCERLTRFDLDTASFDQATTGTRVRLFRTLLPSVTELAGFTWNQAFEACFLEVRAPYLSNLQVWLDVDDEPVFS